jgi:hypothetical protein
MEQFVFTLKDVLREGWNVSKKMGEAHIVTISTRMASFDDLATGQQFFVTLQNTYTHEIVMMVLMGLELSRRFITYRQVPDIGSRVPPAILNLHSWQIVVCATSTKSQIVARSTIPQFQQATFHIGLHELTGYADDGIRPHLAHPGFVGASDLFEIAKTMAPTSVGATAAYVYCGVGQLHMQRLITQLNHLRNEASLPGAWTGSSLADDSIHLYLPPYD